MTDDAVEGTQHAFIRNITVEVRVKDWVTLDALGYAMKLKLEGNRSCDGSVNNLSGKSLSIGTIVAPVEVHTAQEGGLVRDDLGLVPRRRLKIASENNGRGPELNVSSFRVHSHGVLVRKTEQLGPGDASPMHIIENDRRVHIGIVSVKPGSV